MVWLQEVPLDLESQLYQVALQKGGEALSATKFLELPVTKVDCYVCLTVFQIRSVRAQRYLSSIVVNDLITHKEPEAMGRAVPSRFSIKGCWVLYTVL